MNSFNPYPEPVGIRKMMRLKSEAKRLSSYSDIPLSKALDVISIALGYENWPELAFRNQDAIWLARQSDRSFLLMTSTPRRTQIHKHQIITAHTY